MGKIIAKIVLTGGPCAGKTTALSKIEENLIEQGYHVFMVPEGATELINGGIRPFGNNKLNMFDFEEMIIKYQMLKEKLYENAIEKLPDNEKCIIIYDRGFNDAKGFINQELYDKLLDKLNLNELDLLDNYDMVLHLVTAADGKEEFYTLDNNSARSETIEEAKKIDKQIINAWSGHSNFKIIDNSTDFEEKIKKVINEINNLIGSPITIKKQRKYLIDLKSSNLSYLNKDNSTIIKINQTYLKNDDNNYEKRLRKRTYNGNNTYYFTVQKKINNGESSVVTDKKITEEEYIKILSNNKKNKSISKTRISFIYEKQYFKLDIFDDMDLCLLEVEQTLENSKVTLPKFISVIDDVTNDKNYSNINLAIENKNKVLTKLID